MGKELSLQTSTTTRAKSRKGEVRGREKSFGFNSFHHSIKEASETVSQRGQVNSAMINYHSPGSGVRELPKLAH